MAEIDTPTALADMRQFASMVASVARVAELLSDSAAIEQRHAELQDSYDNLSERMQELRDRLTPEALRRESTECAAMVARAKSEAAEIHNAAANEATELKRAARQEAEVIIADARERAAEINRKLDVYKATLQAAVGS